MVCLLDIAGSPTGPGRAEMPLGADTPVSGVVHLSSSRKKYRPARMESFNI